MRQAETGDPKAEYTRRLEWRQKELVQQEARHRLMGNLKLLTVAAAVALIWMHVSAWWLLGPAAVFVFLLVAHERVLRARRRAQRSVAFYQQGLDRLADKWMNSGADGERFQDASHPYASDLDLFGKGGLFQLISAARTRAGEDILAHWLREPGEVPELLKRQEALKELRDRIDLREEMALLGEDAGSGVHAQELAAWSSQKALLLSPLIRTAAFVLVVLLGVALAGWAWFRWPLTPALVLVAAEAVLGFWLHVRVEKVVVEVEQPSHDLALLSEVLVCLEHESFTSPRLAELRAALNTEGVPASRRIARLGRLIELLDSRDHLFMRAAGPLMLWTTQLALAVENWRARYGPSVPGWLEAAGEIEALCSLAAYAYEHSEDRFPEFVVEGPCFDGAGLAHPLLPAARSVRNDVRLDKEHALLLVSGSNMSGKSTLLRTVGVNTVLALAGAPVRARKLRLSVLAIGASMRIHDSLQAGTSHFYAEVLRIRQIVEIAAGRTPAIFLLDELLHGTNSHDRRIGAGAILRTLLKRGAIGLATTHDLALADIADELAPRAENVHFEDQLENGRIRFDYRMRPGVVSKSNALELMRSVGLEV